MNEIRFWKNNVLEDVVVLFFILALAIYSLVIAIIGKADSIAVNILLYICSAFFIISFICIIISMKKNTKMMINEDGIFEYTKDGEIARNNYWYQNYKSSISYEGYKNRYTYLIIDFGKDNIYKIMWRRSLIKKISKIVNIDQAMKIKNEILCIYGYF